ncbi:hypothetical protein T552_00935 [Pneumocystis carinii B80]|uniref:Ribosomal protein L1 n=1 Tax=Pneumocystis carinii (strain B80) TaxID=1408658 RepID=A0A0W4ZMY9_PNEC8|nr:hypothetical protein T552_00935 [Pneumocystis carinii B80]KTW29728.1 hypothetical protein T552_00935 [Pneumocystis carinii B80]
MIKSLVRINRIQKFPGIRFFAFFFREKSTKKRKRDFVLTPMPNVLPFPMALRYLRASEVGWPNRSSTIEVHLRLFRKKRALPLKGQLMLPFPIRPGLRICVISEGHYTQEAIDSGAVIAGSDEVIKDIIQGHINFDICIAHKDSSHLLEKISGVPGSKNWMPSVKNGTICTDIGKAVKIKMNGIDFQEKNGVIRVPIAKASFSDSEIRSNLLLFLEHIGVIRKKEVIKSKSPIAEIVLSSSHGMGIILDPHSIL